MTDLYRDWEPLPPAEAMVRGGLLVLAPHPDDEILGAGGLMAAHALRGAPITVAVVTDGRGGGAGAGTPDELAELRRQETDEAARRIGNVAVVRFEIADGGARAAADLRDRIGRLLAATRPATFALPSPFEIHPDHRATALAGLRAAVHAAFGGEILCYEVGAMGPVNVLVDVTAVFDRKIDALRAYRSQLAAHDLVEKVSALNRARTVNVDLPAVRHAEGYIRVLPAEILPWLAEVEALILRTEAFRPRFDPA